MLNIRLAVSTFSIGLMILGASLVSGQDYPSKPIRIVVAAAGGGSDFAARQIAQGISGPLGQPVIVENRPQGVLAAEAALKAPPDGYTLTVQGPSLWLLPLLRKMPYDVVSDFSPISLLVRDVNVLVVHPSVPVKSVEELIALARAKLGELDYGSSGTGTSPNIMMELFKSMAGVNIVHIPYKGNAPAITALLSGEVQLAIIDVGFLTPHAKLGKLGGLAVTGATTSALAPGLPTVAAAGVPGYEATGMTGIWAPGKTHGAIINRLNQEIVRVLNLPDVKKRFLDTGSEVVSSSSEEHAAKIKSDVVKLGKLIKDAGIKVD